MGNYRQSMLTLVKQSITCRIPTDIDMIPHTVKSVLRGHCWDKEKVVF